MSHAYSRSLIVLLFFLPTLSVLSQEVPISLGGTINTCSGTFVDTNGESGDHSPAGTVNTLTICSDNSGTGTHVQLGFTFIELDGTMTIFNGNSTSADTLRKLDNSNNGTNTTMAATASNTSGCLTVTFESNGQRAGWTAVIGCVTACQPVVAELTSASPAPDQDGYINVCAGDPITLSAQGFYPEDGVIYDQNDNDATFKWNFQDGTTKFGQTVTHAYEQAGGYVVQLIITDQQGCKNSNRISQRVRVAPSPDFNSGNASISPLCPGEDLTLSLTDASDGDVFINPQPRLFSFITGQTFAELTVIPDTLDLIYSSSLEFLNFNPAQRLIDGSEIVEICITIEHSYIGDLDIWIECPDDNKVYFLRHDPSGNGAGGQTFGYGELDDTGPEPAETYCWTATADQTLVQVARTIDVTDPNNPPVIPFDRKYLPVEGSFASLAGCELNGEWTLNVVDNLEDDDGTIYDWTITFASDLYPEQEDFTVDLNSVEWVETGINSSYSPERVVYTAGNPGFANQLLTTSDEYGCSFDTLVRIDVLSPYSADCFECPDDADYPDVDTTICSGNSFVADPFKDAFPPTDTVTWQAFENRQLTIADYPVGVPFESVITVTDQSPGTLTSVSEGLVEVCLDYSASNLINEVSANLVSPSGQTFALISQGNNLGSTLQRCFTPATTPALSDLAGSTINGDWTLRIQDLNENNISQLRAWSIAFVHRTDVTYSWSPANGELSCTDCAAPTITPMQSGSYTLTATSSDGCTLSSTVNVTIGELDLNVTPTLVNPGCGLDNGSISLAVVSANAPLIYAWSNGAISRDISNLAAGDYTVSVTGNTGCTQTLTYTLTQPPPLSIAVDSVIDVRCFGGSTGEIQTTTAGGSPPYSFRWSDANVQDAGDAGALSAGTYSVTVTDAAGCTSSVSATVEEPTPVDLSFDNTPTSCRGGDDGTATVVATGGSGNFTYAWQTGSTDAMVTGLVSDTYAVTVTDSRGCSLVDSVSISQPALALTATTSAGRPGCFGVEDNIATVTPSGGDGNYSYLWSNGETTATATALPGGMNEVIVTDGNGCAQPFTVNLTELPQIEVNLVADAPSCDGKADGKLGAVVTGGLGNQASDYSYLWSNGEEGLITTQIAGGRSYSVTVTDRQGCTGVGQRFLSNPPPITFDVLTDPVDCFGAETGRLSIVNIDGPNPGDYDIRWGAAGGFSREPTIENQAAGTYTVSVIDLANCTVDTTLTIPTPDPLTASVSKQDLSCYGDTDGRIEVAARGGTGSYGYRWSNGASQAELTQLTSGDYTLTLTDANNCEETFTYSILSPAPIVVSATSLAATCAGEATGQIMVSANGGRSPYVFSLDNSSYTRSPNFVGLPAGNYFAYARDSTGCVDNITLRVDDGPDFSIDLGPDTTLIFGDSITLDAALIGGVGMVNFNWRGSYEGTLSCTDCASPTALPDYEIDYYLSVIDENGCEDSDRLRVNVRKIREVAVPTGFSPNGDNRNDRLLVHGRPGTRVLSLMVFDRWGGLIFEDGDFMVNDTDRGWDGLTSGGEPVNAGVYLYKINIEYEDGSQETLSGQTTLIL